MTILKPEQILQYRTELAEYPEAINALDAIEECEGDIEVATTLIASRSGESVLMSDSLLNNLVDRAREYLCKPENKDGWDDLKDVIDILKQILPAPAPLAVTCALKLSEIGLRNLCKAKTNS
ncbi:hypothetical protein QUA81_21220 [Microcoleus sp. F6_B4]